MLTLLFRALKEILGLVLRGAVILAFPLCFLGLFVNPLGAIIGLFVSFVLAIWIGGLFPAPKGSPW